MTGRPLPVGVRSGRRRAERSSGVRRGPALAAVLVVSFAALAGCQGPGGTASATVPTVPADAVTPVVESVGTALALVQRLVRAGSISRPRAVVAGTFDAA